MLLIKLLLLYCSVVAGNEQLHYGNLPLTTNSALSQCWIVDSAYVTCDVYGVALVSWD